MVGNEVDSGQGQPRATGLHQGHRTEGCVGGFNDYWRVCMLQMILSTASSYNMFVRLHMSLRGWSGAGQLTFARLQGRITR